MAIDHAVKSSQIKDDIASHEKALTDTISKLMKISEETVNIHKDAAIAVEDYAKKLHEALGLSEGDNFCDMLWKKVNSARVEKEKALTLAKKKALETKNVIEKLKNAAKKLSEHDTSSLLVKDGENMASKYLSELQKAEFEVAAAEEKANTEYDQLVKTSKEQFRRELQMALPSYLQGDNDKSITEDDLNLLIGHAYHQIEQLQKQIAELQQTEKIRVDEAMKKQKMQDEMLTESMMQTKVKKCLDLESATENHVTSLKAKFNDEMHQQLLLQIAAHSDHLQEALKIQEQELKRKHVLELKEKLLHQRGVFILETSGNIVRLKAALEYLKAKDKFDESSKKAQALWLACQAILHKITEDKSGSLRPLAKYIAALKIAFDENSEFVNCVVASIPMTSLSRGVFTIEILKERFEKVKSVCKNVALVDENNDNLYRYFLSYLQSFLIIHSVSKPKEVIDGKIAVDTSKWDTFDILQRITYCLNIDDLEQALHYANQLEGEPKAVAKDWMDEVKLLLETQLAVKALLAHAVSVSVQAYH